MRRLSLGTCTDFLDFAGTQRDADGQRSQLDAHWERVARHQLAGAVALYNRLCDGHLAWLADEVGMGKTFVALGVAALFRHEHPEARILYLLPSTRLQPQWERQIRRFTQDVVQQVDQRARTVEGTTARPRVEPRRLIDLAAQLAVDPDRDVLAPLSAFSFALSSKESTSWRRHWESLTALSPHLPARLPSWCYRRKRVFKEVFAAGLNLILPRFDLVICDESHNLKGGAGHTASRNRSLALALGGHRPDLGDHQLPWDAASTPRVDRLLCLTATPVERGFAEMSRQAEVFGFDASAAGRVPDRTLQDLAALRSENADERKPAARRLTIRRLHELHRDGNDGLTKNQYRREWRYGGLSQHDAPLPLPSDRERLLVALVQKRVLQVLHHEGRASVDRAAMPSFQMGMLSSFESFHETLANREPDESTHEGHEIRDARVRQGLDSRRIDALCRSYRERFGTAPPHPKMDQVAARLADWAEEGGKSLVFVRRVRTTEELADKVGVALSERLAVEVREALPASLCPTWDEMLDRWRATRREDIGARPVAADGDDDADQGGSDTLFAWFFRGAGTKGHHQELPTGASLRRQCFQDAKHAWSTLFHDNHVQWLLEASGRSVEGWAEARLEALEREARLRVSAVAQPGPRHLFEAWQPRGSSCLREMTNIRRRRRPVGCD